MHSLPGPLALTQVTSITFPTIASSILAMSSCGMSPCFSMAAMADWTSIVELKNDHPSLIVEPLSFILPQNELSPKRFERGDLWVFK